MVRDALIQIISQAVEELLKNQVIDQSVKLIPVEIEPPKQADHGDFATNFCLVASKAAKTNPRALAETLLPAILAADAKMAARLPGESRDPQPENSTNHPSLSGEGKGWGDESTGPTPSTPNPLTEDRGGIKGGVDETKGATGATSDRNSGDTGDTSVSLPRTGEGQGGVDTNSGATGETSTPIKAILSAEIAGPGFINFHLNPAWVAQFLTEVLQNPNDFYKPKNDHPQKINVEHVSVNPNGPITIGSGRGAAFGSALCNVLEAAGNTVHREYYINDGVNSEQMRLFAESVKAIIEGRPVPDNGYKGDYVHGVASEIHRLAEDIRQLRRILDGYAAGMGGGNGVDTLHYLTEESKLRRHSDFLSYLYLYRQRVNRKRSALESIQSLETRHLSRLCEKEMIADQDEALQAFRVFFNLWFSEQSLHDSGEVEKTLQHLIANGVADDKPIRTKVVMAKGGIIKEVLKEVQPTDEDDADPQNEANNPLTEDRGGIKGGADENQGGTGEISDTTDHPSHIQGRGRGGVEQTEANSNKTIWLRSTKFGDDQDRVLKRKDGRLTYIASDVAYHKDKFNRPAGGDKLITVLGPDHHGYIARLTAVVAAMFSDQVEPLNNPEPLNEHEALIYDSIEDRNQSQAALAWAKEPLEVQIFQHVRFLKDGKPAPMRKRDGNIYALIDLINEIGATLKPEGTEQEKQQAGSDVARFFYLMRHHDTAMDFDLELATKQSDENPVFYVQYAHARICSVIEKAGASGLSLPSLSRHPGESRDPQIESSTDHPSLSGEGQGWGLNKSYSLLQHPKELTLILKVLDLQNEVARTAEDYSVNRLTTYAIELARTYHSFYDSCRVIQPDQPELSQARLALCHATQIALKSALDLLGVSAPNRMERSV
ncbi:MAG: arginine--tRNA ligase [Fimbriimonadaceae bacterium]